jgi:hypothetical protein
MTKAYKSIVSIVLVVSMLLCAVLPAFAAGGEEEYISELRLIYAEDYEEAMEILSEGEFRDYKILNENLNEDSDEIGVWLAYKTTTNIDDAITDLAVMQMNGGYKDGNFQDMIKKSYDDYVALGITYLEAIEYFAYALDAGDFLAEMAYRQLNFYNVETQEGIGLEIPAFEGEKLGDIFREGWVDEYTLATMFLEGNSYALKNIRSLIAMGVSYNEDGKTYLEKVADAAAQMNADETVFEDEDYDTLASAIVLALPGLQDILKELALYEDDFNYADGEFTAEELRYLEIKAIADTMRETEYLDGQSLYGFILKYQKDEKGDLSSLYPLVAAMNDGQAAMTKVSHFYDVVRYSCAVVAEDVLGEELEAQEAIYGENPFNLYTGVDRSLYLGTFALTTEAERADAYSEIDMMNQLLNIEYSNAIDLSIATGICGIGMLALGAMSRYFDVSDQAIAFKAYSTAVKNAGEGVGAKMTDMPVLNESVSQYFNGATNSYQSVVDAMYHSATGYEPDVFLTFTQKVDYVANYSATHPGAFNESWGNFIADVKKEVTTAKASVAEVSATAPVSLSTGLFFVAGAALTLYSAYKLGTSIYNHYHPDYDDVPIAMVDLVETVDGDRYIKYDVVYNAETNEDGVYEAGDLNAFEARLWNALYYTKSYEAGKPLLADNFVVSNNNNKPREGYTPVHRFGEVVCYNLNKYNFDGDTQIYLSVKQSKNDKSAVKDVPEIVGSMFGTGLLFLAGGVGAIAGVGGVLATQEIIKKKKTVSAEHGEDKAQAEE